MKEIVRERYARAARELPKEDVPPSLGVGDPVALAGLRARETVLDLGSGPGRDLLEAARAVGPQGRAIGVDMTAEMRERAREAARAAGLDNISILDGDLERLPIHCGAVDVVISNCVINLVEDKHRALVDAYRVLRPGGRLAIVDTAFDSEPAPSVREDPEAWACCVGGALVANDYVAQLEAIGFEDVRLDYLDASCGEACGCADTVRSVTVRARKPGSVESGSLLHPAVLSDLDRIEALLGGSAPPRIEDAIVALEEGRVTGVVALERYGEAALLRSLAVAPERRRQGLGTRLTLAALEAARWSGAEEVFLLTQGAESFFERLLFAPVSRKRAGFACASDQLASAECESAVAMRLSFEESSLPAPSRKELPTFQNGACC